MKSGLVGSLGRRERLRDKISIALMIVLIVLAPLVLVKFLAGRSYEPHEPHKRFLAALRADPVLDLDPPPGAIELSHFEEHTGRNDRGGHCSGAYIQKRYTGSGLSSLDEVRGYYHRKVLDLGWVYENGSHDRRYTDVYVKTVASRTGIFGLANGSGAGDAFTFTFNLHIVAEESDCRKIPG